MAFVIREIEVSRDQGAIEALWADNVDSDFPGRYDWLYQKSPYGEPLTVVAEDDKAGAVIGCTSIFPHVIHHDGSQFKYGIAYDFVVHEKHRVFGPAVKLQSRLVEAAMEKGFEFILGFPNKAAQGVMKRVGYSILGNAVMYSKLLNAQGKIQQKYGTGLAGKLLSLAVNAALAGYDQARRVLLKPGLQLREVKEFDVQCEAARQSGIAGLVEAEKSHAYLNWRYVTYKGQGYRIVQLLRKRDEKNLGYCVFYVHRGVAVIVDIKLDDFETNFNQLMIRLALMLRKEGLASMTLMYLGNPVFLRKLKSSLFIRRPETRDCFIYMSESFRARHGDVVGNLNNWMLLDADMDL